jgi:hypothetical protein
MIRYSLTKNTMNPDSNEYIAVVSQWEKTGLDQIIDYMVAEGTGLTRPQALAYFEKLVQSFEHFIEMRGGVSTPLCTVRTTITGVFGDTGDKFDPKRHDIHFRIAPGSRLKELKNRLQLKKVNSQECTPDPLLFIDSASGTTNQSATPQSIATLRGNNLKFDPDDPAQGIFFIPETGSKVNVRVNVYSIVRTREVHFQIPHLLPGNYTIVIQALMRRHTSIRGGVLEELITVC